MRDRERFEQEYRDWIRLMSRDAAFRLLAMLPEARVRVLRAYEEYREPLSVFRKITEQERVSRLAGERLSQFIVVETWAVTFFPTVHRSLPGALDFAVAMNRRIFFQGLWYPIIALNSEYIRLATDRILRYALEHEFEMSRIYQEISSDLRTISQDEKEEIMESALDISKERMSITPDELREDERLMDRLSRTQPLIPKPYAEMAMLLYLEAHAPELQPYGRSSRDPEEDAFGRWLYDEFEGWSGLSRSTYDLFVREIKLNLKETDQGYG
ncbi:MAG: hypothetical protein QUS08_09005 [Methanothrix sp.]|nr:hypothetical protein [Methanothrix sp.]